jgi:hypothetical protein
MKSTLLATAVAAAMLSVGAAHAKVPANEADRLGKDLTCTGGIKAANADGSIPAYTGKWVGKPPGVEYEMHAGKHPVDVYKGEKPLFVITAANVAQYAERLSDGQKALFAKYPNTFQIPVYPGRRDFAYSPEICAIAKKNALEAELIDDGMGVKGYKGAIPFPIPKNGLELVWNNAIPSRAFTEDTTRDFANVLPNGSISWGRARNVNFDLNNEPSMRGKPIEGIMAYQRSFTLGPEREKGAMSLSQEPLNFRTAKRLAWSYDPGTRRVRQLPEFGFDQPLNGTGGSMTIDSDRLFNGSPERYDWKMVGKREMYVPANAYKVHESSVKYADLLKPGHANPEFLRYELRRVWVLEATLKQGFRHLYAKRVLFLDEDTGMAVAADKYDGRGQLWQHAFVNYYYAFDIQAWQAGTSFYHDLNKGSYIGYNLFQERPLGPILNKGGLSADWFTPAAMRASGN